MANVIFCDDEQLVSRAARRVLMAAHHTCVAVPDAESALTALERLAPDVDVVVSDLWMPGRDGVRLLADVERRAPSVKRILISGAADLASVTDAVNLAGVFAVLHKPFDASVLIAKIEEAAAARRLEREREQMTLEGLIAALDLRDPETQSHSRRVGRFARRLGLELGLRGQELRDCELGALLHDVGKIGVRDAVLLKPGPLDASEWVEMRRHPSLGHQVLRAIPFLGQAAEIVLAHHERWDGSGYPAGLAHDAIPIGARIFAVVDAFDAITSDRPYRRARDYEAAKTEIVSCAGTQFDPVVVGHFLRVDPREWETLR